MVDRCFSFSRLLILNLSEERRFNSEKTELFAQGSCCRQLLFNPWFSDHINTLTRKLLQLSHKWKECVPLSQMRNTHTSILGALLYTQRCTSGAGVIAILHPVQTSFLPQVYDRKSTCAGSLYRGAGGLRVKVEWRRVLTRLVSYIRRNEVKWASSLDQPKPCLNRGADIKTAFNVITITRIK